jgi:hypothetical protein
MGIKKLFTFLDNNNLYKKYSYLNDLISDLDIDKNKLLVGVDGNLFCYKYTHSYDNMLIGFFNQILKFLSNKIIPLYIFDGGTLQEKENTNLFRYQKKIAYKYKLEQVEEQIDIITNNTNNINNTNCDETNNKDELLLIKKKLEKNSTIIKNDNILILLELFDLLNIPYLFSYGEGEYLAVMLNKYNIIDFFLSDDTDPLPAGINKTIKFYNNSVYYLETKQIYEQLNLNINEFCDFCILLGSDYAIFNHYLKPIELYEIILKYKSIEQIISNNIIDCINDETIIIVNKIRNIYYNSDNFEKNMFIKNKNIFNNNINSKKTLDNTTCNTTSINLIDHTNISYYSNIILEFWDEYIDVISLTLNTSNNNVLIEKSDKLKSKICKYIYKSKYNIKNIIKFIKNNIKDITSNEINNMITSFEFLNKFGI